MTSYEKIPLPEKHDEWLEMRRSGIGGSDVAAIIGLSPYTGAYTVWADKLGLLPPIEDKECMRQGRDLEDYVSERFAELSGFKVHRENFMLRSVEHPFMLANTDRRIVGRDAGLECKTTSAYNTKNVKGVDFPEIYYCQCVHYMAVKDAREWFLAVLILGIGFKTFRLTRDENPEPLDWLDGTVHVDDEEITALIEAEADFWEKVKSGTPPEMDGLDRTMETVRTLHPTNEEETEPAMLYGMEGVMQHLEEMKQMEKTAVKGQKEAKARIRAAMGNSSRGYMDGYEVKISTVHKKESVVKASSYELMKFKATNKEENT